MNACLFSGGKDSTLALHKAIESGVNIDALITIKPTSEESYMFHWPNVDLTEIQAEAMGLKHIFAYTEGVKEEELKDLEEVLVKNNVKLLVTGATYSKYQFDRIAAIAKRNKIENVAPLWHIDPITELNEIAEKYTAIITSVSAEGLDETFLGERIDKKMIKRLEEVHKKYQINMLFEGGEAESFVLDAPLFKKKIEIKKAHKVLQHNIGRYIIDEAEFAEK